MFEAYIFVAPGFYTSSASVFGVDLYGVITGLE